VTTSIVLPRFIPGDISDKIAEVNETLLEALEELEDDEPPDTVVPPPLPPPHPKRSGVQQSPIAKAN